MPNAGERVKALDFTAAQTDSDATTLSNISTTAAAGSPEVSVTFTAPTSGKVQVSLSLRGQDDGAANATYLDLEVYETDVNGTQIITTGSVDRRLELRGNTSSTPQNASKTFILTGLTAGQVYFARTMHYASAGSTADVLNRRIDVVPLPA